jgi:hypothetical protein
LKLLLHLGQLSWISKSGQRIRVYIRHCLKIVKNVVHMQFDNKFVSMFKSTYYCIMPYNMFNNKNHILIHAYEIKYLLIIRMIKNNQTQTYKTHKFTMQISVRETYRHAHTYIQTHRKKDRKD